MPVFDAGQRTVHDMHGSRFESYVAPSSGSRELCAWRTTVAPGQMGATHTVDHEEVFLVLAGSPTITLDGDSSTVDPSSVILVPAGTAVCLSNPGDTAAVLWVTTVVGLSATVPTGERISPPWAR